MGNTKGTKWGEGLSHMDKYGDVIYKKNRSKTQYTKLLKALDNLWLEYGELDACSREEIVELKKLKSLIENRLDIISASAGYKESAIKKSQI